MRSIRSRMMNLLFRSVGAKKMFSDFHSNRDSAEGFKAAVDKARGGGDYQAIPAETLQAKYSYEQVDIGGFGLSLLGIGKQKRVILFLHGGAYVLGMSKPHWDFLEKICEKADYHVAALDYPLAPEHDCTAAIERSLEAYEFLAERYGAENVVLMGDSAGGGLAMGLSLHLRDQGRPQPRSTVLLYPWLDVTMSHPDARGIESNDLLLGIDGLIACGKYYAGERDMTDPLVSPWFGKLDGLAPVHVFTGTWDVLHPEGRDFVEKVKAAGGEASLSVYPEMQHAWLLFGMPESQKAIGEICEILRQ